MSAPPALQVRALSVAYDRDLAVHEVDLSVGVGEVVALLGPSGSGKSTLLHAVAGFLAPSAGEVWLHGRRVSSPSRVDPPERRDVAVVFQNGALWPHLSAVDTVAYPLRRRRMGKARARAEAVQILDRLDVGHLARRRPAELSGGEAQRVGLARALARGASLYLFDEPTANLDTHVRALFLTELAERQRVSGTAGLYATHDAEEALGLADRIVLLRDGRVVQVGPPELVYSRPVDLWAARLTGPATYLSAPLVSVGTGTGVVDIAGERVRVRCEAGGDGPGSLLVRPGWAHLGGTLPGRLRAVWFRGPHSDHQVETPAGEVLIREPGGPRGRVGDRVGWSLERVWPLAAPGARPQPPRTTAGPD